MIKAGLVHTPMTAAFTNKGPLWAGPNKVGATIVTAGEKGGPIVYAPWFWKPIMLIIRYLPSTVFNKLNV